MRLLGQTYTPVDIHSEMLRFVTEPQDGYRYLFLYGIVLHVGKEVGLPSRCMFIICIPHNTQMYYCYK